MLVVSETAIQKCVLKQRRYGETVKVLLTGIAIVVGISCVFYLWAFSEEKAADHYATRMPRVPEEKNVDQIQGIITPQRLMISFNDSQPPPLSSREFFYCDPLDPKCDPLWRYWLHGSIASVRDGPLCCRHWHPFDIFVLNYVGNYQDMAIDIISYHTDRLLNLSLTPPVYGVIFDNRNTFRDIFADQLKLETSLKGKRRQEFYELFESFSDYGGVLYGHVQPFLTDKRRFITADGGICTNFPGAPRHPRVLLGCENGIYPTRSPNRERNDRPLQEKALTCKTRATEIVDVLVFDFLLNIADRQGNCFLSEEDARVVLLDNDSGSLDPGRKHPQGNGTVYPEIMRVHLRDVIESYENRGPASHPPAPRDPIPVVQPARTGLQRLPPPSPHEGDTPSPKAAKAPSSRASRDHVHHTRAVTTTKSAPTTPNADADGFGVLRQKLNKAKDRSQALLVLEQLKARLAQHELEHPDEISEDHKELKKAIAELQAKQRRHPVWARTDTTLEEEQEEDEGAEGGAEESATESRGEGAWVGRRLLGAGDREGSDRGEGVLQRYNCVFHSRTVELLRKYMEEEKEKAEQLRPRKETEKKEDEEKKSVHKEEEGGLGQDDVWGLGGALRDSLKADNIFYRIAGPARFFKQDVSPFVEINRRVRRVVAYVDACIAAFGPEAVLIGDELVPSVIVS